MNKKHSKEGEKTEKFKDTLVKLTMTFQEAMHKALSTPLPKKSKKKK